MFRAAEVLRRHNLVMWLGPIVGAALVGLSLVRILSRNDGLYTLLGSVDMLLSFVFYPFGVLQFIFLNLIGELTTENVTQFTPVRILGFVVVFRRFVDLTFRGRSLNMVKAPPMAWAFLFVFSLGLSTLTSGDISESLTTLLTYVQLLIMFFLIIDFVRGERELKYLVVVLVLGGAVNAGFAVYQFYFESLARVMGTIGNANRFGIIQLALLCQIAPLLGSTPGRGLSPALLLMLAPIAYSILLSFSRGAFLAAVVVALYYLLFMRSGQVRPKVAVAAVFIVGLVLAPEGFYHRLESIPAALSGTHLREGSIPTRLLYYTAGIQMGLDHLLTGVGLGRFNHHIASYANLQTVRAGGAHNMYISVFAEAGGIGLIAFLGFLATSFVGARSSRRLGRLGTSFQTAFANSVELGNVAFLVGGLFATLEYSKVLWILLAFAMVVRKLGMGQKDTISG
jgi:O-antigen ligase